MSYASDPADQIVRYTLEGTEVALKLSGLAAKNFAMFAYAALNDKKKTRGKTRLTRMLKEQKPLKFFEIPEDRMREFAQEAKRHGLLFVPMRDKAHPCKIEIAIFAQDAAKVNRIMDRMQLDFVKADAGEAVPEHSVDNPPSLPPQEGARDTSLLDNEENGNFMTAWADHPTAERNPFELSSGSRNSSPTPSAEDRPSVRDALLLIRQEQASHKTSERGRPTLRRSKVKEKVKTR